MRTFLGAIVAALCVGPASVFAVVFVQTDLQHPLSGFFLPGQTVSFDVYATTDEPATNERANAFTIAVVGRGFGDAPGLPRFVIPAAGPEPGTIHFPLPSAAHPYLFGEHLDLPDADPHDPSSGLSDADTVAVAGAIEAR